MKIILGLLTALWVGGVIAEINPSRPLLTIADEKGVPISGITQSTTELAAAAKISKLPDGTYLILRPPISITVKHALVEPNVAPVAVTGGDQVVSEGTMVFLPCNLSYDTDGSIVKCQYTQIVKPGDPMVEILYTPTGQAYFIQPDTSDRIAGGG